MKVRLVPVYFKSGMDEDFKTQLERLHQLLVDEADILEPVSLGSELPEADAVVFPHSWETPTTKSISCRQLECRCS